MALMEYSTFNKKGQKLAFNDYFFFFLGVERIMVERDMISFGSIVCIYKLRGNEKQIAVSFLL